MSRSGNAYTLTGEADEVPGLEITFAATANNDGDVTVRIGSGGSTRSLRRDDGEQIAAGELDGRVLCQSHMGRYELHIERAGGVNPR